MGSYGMSLGTLLLGIFINTYLFGLVTYQFAKYYRTKFNDRLATKCTVFFLFVLDTFHSVALIYMAWYYAVDNYDNPASLETSTWPYPVTPLSTALTALITQMYLGRRIYRLTNSKLLFGVVIVLATTTFVLGVITGIEAWVIWVWAKLPRITNLVIAAVTMQVITDTFICITLIVVLWGSRTGLRRSDSVVNRLIRGAVQTGLFAGIFALGDLISFLVIPSSNLYGTFAIPLGRIYTNTLMDSLLTRESIKADLNRTYDMTEVLGQMRWTDPALARSVPKVRSGNSNLDSIQLEVKGPTQDANGPSSSGGNETGKDVELQV